MVVYLNSFLGLNGTGENPNYFEFNRAGYINNHTDPDPVTVQEYNCEDTYENVTAELLVPDGDGGYTVETVNIWEDFFSQVGREGELVEGFSFASDDSLQVIEHIHTYAPPE